MPDPPPPLKTNSLLLAVGNAGCQWLRAGFLSEICAQPKKAALPKVVPPPQTACIQCLVTARPPFLQGAHSSRALPALAEASVATVLKLTSSPYQSCFPHSFTDSAPESTPSESPTCKSLAQICFQGAQSSTDSY